MKFILVCVISALYAELLLANYMAAFYAIWPISLFIYIMSIFYYQHFIDDYAILRSLTNETNQTTRKILHFSKNKTFTEVFARGYFIDDVWVADPEMPFQSIYYGET